MNTYNREIAYNFHLDPLSRETIGLEQKLCSLTINGNRIEGTKPVKLNKFPPNTTSIIWGGITYLLFVDDEVIHVLIRGKAGSDLDRAIKNYK